MPWLDIAVALLVLLVLVFVTRVVVFEVQHKKTRPLRLIWVFFVQQLGCKFYTVDGTSTCLTKREKEKSLLTLGLLISNVKLNIRKLVKKLAKNLIENLVKHVAKNLAKVIRQSHLACQIPSLTNQPISADTLIS